MTQEFYQERFGLHFFELEPGEFAMELANEYRKEAFVHKNGYISYHDADVEYFQAFKENLAPTGLARRIRFWDKSKIDAGEITKEQMQENLKAATVYIPFITNKFLIDPALQKEM